MAQQTELATLREELAALEKEQTEMTRSAKEDGKLMTEEDFARFDDIDTKKVELKQRIGTLERVEKVEQKNTGKRSDVYGAPAIRVKRKATKQDSNNALRAWIFHDHQRVHVRDEWKRSCDLVGCNWEQEDFYCRSQETDDTNHTGEDFNNGSIFAGFTEAKNWEGTILQYCTIHNDPENEATQPKHITFSDDTSTYGVYKKQNEELVNATLTQDKITLNAHMVTSSVSPVSIHMLMSPQTDVEDYINRNLLARLRRTVARDVMIGDGTDKPRGLFHSSSNVAVGATGFSNNIAPDVIRELEYSVNRAYREGPNVAYCGHDSTAESMETSLVDDLGVQIWANDMKEKAVDRLRGYPFVISNFMPQMASGQDRKVLAFGDFSYMHVRFCGGPKLIRDNSRLVDSLSVWFGSYILADSQYLNPGNDPIKVLRTGTLSGD